MAYTRRKTSRSTSRRRSSSASRSRTASRRGSGSRSSRRVARRVSNRSTSGRRGGSQTVRLVIEQPAAVPAVHSPEQVIAGALAQIAANKSGGDKPQKAKF